MNFERIAKRFRPGFQRQAEHQFPGVEVAAVMAEVYEFAQRTGKVRDLNAVAYSWCKQRAGSATTTPPTNGANRGRDREDYAVFLAGLFAAVGRGELRPDEVADRFELAARDRFASINPRIAERLREVGPTW